jgi:aspartyl-tRNA(Asn)/glutamyl-tRNA(Gln) amidotransferase subunit B
MALEEAEKSGQTIEEVIKEKGLITLEDYFEGLDQTVQDIIDSRPDLVDAYYNGDQRWALSLLMCLAMKETKGRVNPQRVNEIIDKKLKKWI